METFRYAFCIIKKRNIWANICIVKLLDYIRLLCYFAGKIAFSHSFY